MTFAAGYGDDVLNPSMRAALRHACVTVVDQLFADVHAVEEWFDHAYEDRPAWLPATYGDLLGYLAVVGRLPAEYRAWYGPAFVRGFLLATARVGQGLASGWPAARPLYTAEELALDLVVEDAVGWMDVLGWMDVHGDGDGDGRPHDGFEGFLKAAGAGADHRSPRTAEGEAADRERVAAAGPSPALVGPVATWFEPFPGKGLGAPHPFVLDGELRPVDLVTGRPLRA